MIAPVKVFELHMEKHRQRTRVFKSGEVRLKANRELKKWQQSGCVKITSLQNQKAIYSLKHCKQRLKRVVHPIGVEPITC